MADAKRELTPAERLAAHKTVEEVPCITIKEAVEAYNFDFETVDDATVKKWNQMTDDDCEKTNAKTYEELADFSDLTTTDEERLRDMSADHKDDRKAYNTLSEDAKAAWRTAHVMKYSTNKKVPVQNILWIDTDNTRVVLNFRIPYGYVWDLTTTYAGGKAIELDYKEFRLDLEPCHLLRRTRTTGLSGLLPKLWYKYTDEDLNYLMSIFPILASQDKKKQNRFNTTSEGWHYDRNEFYYEVKVNDEKFKDKEGRNLILVITLSPDSLPGPDGTYVKENPMLYWTLSKQTGFNENIAYDDLVFERSAETIMAKLIEMFDPESWETIKMLQKADIASREFCSQKLRNAVTGSTTDQKHIDDALNRITEKNAGQNSALLNVTSHPLYDHNAMNNILGFVSQNLANATGTIAAVTQLNDPNMNTD